MLSSLPTAGIYALESLPSLQHSSHWPIPGPGWHVSLQYAGVPSHDSLRLVQHITTHRPDAIASTEAVVEDPDLGELGIVHTEHDPKTGKPIYTCPTFIYTFDCDECGGAKEITSERPIGGTPNALCIGVGAFLSDSSLRLLVR